MLGLTGPLGLVGLPDPGFGFGILGLTGPPGLGLSLGEPPGRVGLSGFGLGIPGLTGPLGLVGLPLFSLAIRAIRILNPITNITTKTPVYQAGVAIPSHSFYC